MTGLIWVSLVTQSRFLYIFCEYGVRMMIKDKGSVLFS
jgi:hypothetical protein